MFFRCKTDRVCRNMFFVSRRCSTESPVRCLLKRSPQSKKYRAECPFFLLEFWSKSEYPYSAQKSQKLSHLLLIFGRIGWGYPLEVTCRHPRRLRDDFVMIFDGFGPPFGVPGGALWDHFGACFVKWSLSNQFLELFCRTLKKK